MNMLKNLKVTDVTLREFAARRENTLSFRENLEIAKGLERLHVDVIGLPPLQNIKADTLLVRTVASAVKTCTLSLPVGYTEESVAAAWNALASAQKPQLCVSLPVSTVQMEYICHMKAPKLLETVTRLVKAAKACCNDVMFVAEDATRADRAFLCDALNAAAGAGATSFGIQDSAGALLPEEFAALVAELAKAVPALSTMPFTVQCTNELSLAAAATVSALKTGASGVAVVVDGNSAPSLLSVARIVAAKGGEMGFSCSLGVTELHRALKKMGRFFGNGEVVEKTYSSNITEDSVKVALTKEADQAAVSAAVQALGYELTAEDLVHVFEEFCRVAEKKTVSAPDLEAIVATSAMQVSPTYKLVSYVINSGNQISATAHVKFEKDGKIIEGVSIGDGPIDAAFMAIEQIVGRHFELDDFQIQSVTQGREAVGSALVKLREGGHLYSGNGISTDIIGASIRAYVSALNKIAHDAK